MEMEEDDLENSDSDTTELYGILANKNDVVVCKNLIRPCILGTDFLKKHDIFAGWTPTGKFKLIFHQELLVESLEVLIKGPMTHNRQELISQGEVWQWSMLLWTQENS